MLRKDAWVPKEVQNKYKLLRFLIDDRGKCRIELKKYNDNRFFVSSLIPLSPASEAGLKVGDILCKPGTKGGCLNSEDQYLKNIQIENNRPILVEVLRILTDDELVNGLLKKEQIKEVMLGKIHDARLEFGSVVDQLCKLEVYLMSFTYHMMATTILGENMPQVPLELLNHMYYSMIYQGPGSPTTFVGDQLHWKPKCSKCEKSCTTNVMICTPVSS